MIIPLSVEVRSQLKSPKVTTFLCLIQTFSKNADKMFQKALCDSGLYTVPRTNVKEFVVTFNHTCSISEFSRDFSLVEHMEFVIYTRQPPPCSPSLFLRKNLSFSSSNCW